MIKKLKGLALKFMVGALLVLPVAVPMSAYAASSSIANNLNCGADLTLSNVSDAGCAPTDEDAGTLDRIIKFAINIFSVVVGVIAVVMIIIGGLKYITSGGESGNITGAKNTILYAIVGLVVVALAQFVVRFVLKQTTDAVTN